MITVEYGKADTYFFRMPDCRAVGSSSTTSGVLYITCRHLEALDLEVTL